MIADKSTSLGYKQLIYNLNKNQSVGPSYMRSVVLQWLQMNYNDPAEFLHNIAANGFDPDNLLLGVRPKERELKLAARLFGLLPMQKRIYVVITETEALLAECILPY